MAGEAYFRTKNYPGLKDFNMNYYQPHLILKVENLNQYTGYVFYRKGEFYSKQKLLFKNEFFKYSETNARIIENKLNAGNIIFTSGSDELFLRT
jgi:hypothetical protein